MAPTTKTAALFFLCFILTGCEQYKRLTGTGDPNDPLVVPHPVTPSVPIAYHVFLADGQSNMVGGHQEYNFDPFDHFKPNGSSFPYKGPAVGFARAYIQRHPDRYVKVVNCAYGGTTISQHQEGGALFEQCLANLQEFMGPNDTMDGILWWQGEHDGIGGTTAGQYTQMFTAYINAMRRRLNKPNLPVAFVQIGTLISPYNGIVTDAPTWEDIKQAQENFVTTDTAMVRSDDQSLIDHIHYNAQSNLTIGARLYNALNWN